MSTQSVAPVAEDHLMRLASKGWGTLVPRTRLLEAGARQVRVGGEWLEVVRVGSGEPLVLLPGLAGGWKLVAPLAERLGRRFEVHVCGLRGDRFPMGGGWATEVADLARDVAEVIGQLRLERPAVVGVSFGGAVALELAAEYPGLPGSLTVVGADAQFRTTIASKIAKRVLERYPLPSDNPFLNQFFNLLHGGEPDSEELAEYVVGCCWETDQLVMARRLALLETFDVSERLWRIDAPTLVLAGTRDVVAPLARQKAMAALIPGARFETIEGAGHVGFLSHRGEVARRIAGQASRVRQGTAW
jgi:pimeloyl-ACP methyl ester carboxylesterase